MSTIQPMWKTSRTATKKAKLKDRLKTKTEEKKNKGNVRKRDRVCRFPLCGCRKLGLNIQARPEVSHDRHKGIGGNRAGDRSTTALMVLLCLHRHQDGIVSRHKGTLRAVYLTSAGYDGPVAWEIDVEAINRHGAGREPHWREVARERTPGVLEPLTDWQRSTLELLAEMDL